MDVTSTDVYLTLLSWASQDYYPNNTPGDFYARLAQPIELYGHWEIGILNLVTRKTFYNINTFNNSFEIYIDGKWVTFTIQQGQYNTIKPLINSINKAYKPKDKSYFVTFNSLTHRVKLDVYDNNLGIKFNSGLADILGFECGKSLTGVGNLSHKVPTLDGARSLLFIESDIVSEQFIGENKLNLLGYVDTTRTGFNELLLHEFDTHYTTLPKTRLETIHITIKDSQLRPIEFMGGETIIKLHIRKL